jgi:hypothetical protein
MFGIVPISPFLKKEKKEKIKFYLIAMGYGYSTIGVKRFQKENGLPITGRIDHCMAFIIERRLDRG